MSPSRAETDLFELCGTAAEFAAVCRAALERVGWPPGDTAKDPASGPASDPANRPAILAAELDAEIAREIDRAREPLAALRDGTWAPLERHLEALGHRYARAGLAVSAWHLIAGGVATAVVERAIAAFPDDAARLASVLRAASGATERAALAAIRGYAADRPDPAERSAARLAILSSASHDFASSTGQIDALLALVARRLAEVVGESCVVRLKSHDGAWLEPTSHVFHPDPQQCDDIRRLVETQRKPVSDGLVGRVATTGAAVRMPEVDLARIERLAPALHALFVRTGVTSVMIVPLRSRGRTVGVISMMRTRGAPPYSEDDQRLAQDIADRAGLAVDNAILVATLEQRVTERTTALEAANKELEAFSYSVSHDLRTPLRSIDGFSLALFEDCSEQLDARARDYLQRIRTGAGRMSALIDDLLALARVSRVALDIVALDLSALAAEIVTELRRDDPARATPVHIAGGLAAHGDARLIRIALENLLGNAWKYTARHPAAQIWVGADGATFHVRDTGAGFDMTYAEKLFAPFQRLHGSREYEGTGIGLAIVDRIVSQHGGRIWATGEIDRGATFFFTLGEVRGAP